MKRSPVTSSSIAAVGYDPATQVLAVEFRPDRHGCATVWEYADVDHDAYFQFVLADSIGRAFASIKASHVGRKVSTIAPDGTETLLEQLV